ncbi:hypothetical protein QCA50_018309 [Cerrena zonata]|uniref:PH domain-containing protein n=1 Tax=Cerrena zonata TaxID=2478898 RepID=A0AAW0FEU2_9APHY
MTDYSSTTGGPRSPLFGTATFSTLSATQTPLSPSRLSSSSTRSYTPTPSSYDSDDVSSNGQMRRIVVSGSPSSSRDSYSDTYTEDDSDLGQSLAQLDEEIGSAIQSWTASPTARTFPESDLPTALSITDYNSILDRDRRVLSTISEHTENISSRPTSFAQSGGAPGSRPVTHYSTSGDNRRSMHVDAGPSMSSHVRSATEPQRTLTPGPRPPPGTRVGEKVAFFEQRSGATSPFIPGHSRTASAPSGPRPQGSIATSTTQSQSMPTMSTFTSGYSGTTGYGSSGYTTTGYGTGTYTSSRPSSPTKSSWGSSAVSEDTRTTPRTSHTYSRSVGGTSTYTGTGTDTYTRTYTGSVTNTDTLTQTYTAPTSDTYTQTASSLRRPQASPRSPLSAVRNIMQKWREQTPSLAKTARSSTTPSPEGGMRRGSRRTRDRAMDSARRVSASSVPDDDDRSMRSDSDIHSVSDELPPPFDLAALGQYAGTTSEPTRFGNLWYLNVHAPPPYRWQRCQALLYPRMLLLTWIAPNGGRGVVTLDLLTCTEVGSTRSPMDPRTADDVGTQAAREQAYADIDLMTLLLPFHLLYGDGVERLAAESPGERARWVEAIWEILNRSVSIPDRSVTGSPTGSIRTIRTINSSVSSHSESGSSSTGFQFFRLSAIPDMSDLHSLDGSSTLSRRASLISTQNTRTLDDSALSGSSYLQPTGTGVIGPTRMRSLRRTSSLTDLGEDIESAARLARQARGGLGFGLGLVGLPVGEGAPVTVSSGPRLRGDVRLTPPPRSRASSRTRGSSETSSDDAFFSAGSRSATTRTPTSSYYSSSSFTRGLLSGDTGVEITSGTGTNIVTSTLSYRGTASASMLGDSHTGTTPYGSSATPTSSGTSLTRSGGMRRRTGTLSSRSYTTSYLSGSEEYSDKENTDSYTYTGTRSYTDSRYNSGFSTLESYSYGASRSATPSRTDLSSSRPASYISDGTEESVPEGVRDEPTPSEYATAKSPSDSLASLPTIPSISDYETAEVCSTTYDTAEPYPSTPTATDFQTAELCPTETESEYVTCEICGSEISTEYQTAECHCKKTERAPSITETPSSVSTVPLTPSMVPLPKSAPASTYSPSEVSDIELSSEEPVPTPSSVSTPSFSLTSESETLPGPSPIPSPLPDLSLTPLETISTPTESSVITSSSEVSLTVPSSLQRASVSSPSLLGSSWGNESDRSYESSVLRASPSIRSVAVPDIHDTSFETSGLRPSASPSVESEVDLTIMTPASEVSTPSISSPSIVSSESITPTPSTLSLPPSVPSPTPVSTEKSQVSLSRTPSSVSTASSISMRSSVFYPRSLFEEPLDQDLDDISTEPSLLSTAISSVSSSPPLPILPVSPRDIALPSSPAPSVSFSVSVSTPRGDIPSIRDSLLTVPSEQSRSPGPSHILTHDVNVLLRHLHELEETRGPQIQEILENVRTIRDNVIELMEERQSREVIVEHIERVREVEDLPPPVPMKDSAAGGDSEISSVRSAASRRIAPSPLPRSAQRPSTTPRLIPIPVTPPPMRKRLASPDTLTETMSFLSSHHSDDFSLMESESYPGRAPSPSWSSPSSSPSSSPVSSLSVPLPEESASVSSISPESSVSYEDTRHLRPPASPTPSSTSSATARPIPPPDVLRLRELLQDVQHQVNALGAEQNSANHMLDNLIHRPTGTDMDTQNRLYRIEEIVQRILDQLAHPAPAPAPAPVPTPGPAPSIQRDDMSDSYTSSSHVSSALARLQEAFRTGFGEEPPPLHMPRPMHAGPTFSELLAQTLATEAPPPRSPIQPPPALITLQFRPGARAARPRSASPTFETTLPDRAQTVPITRPVVFSESRSRPQRVPHRRRQAAPPSSIAESTAYIPPVVPIPAPGTRVRTPGPGTAPPPPDNGEDIDMEREVRNLRSQRRPDQADGVYRPGGPTPPPQEQQQHRPPSAPADLGSQDDGRGPQTWYTRPTTMGDASAGQASQPGQFVVPPPGTFVTVPAPVSTGAPGQPPVIPQMQPIQPPPTILQLPPTFDDIVALLRENRLAHVATIEQQREIMRYLQGLNEWLERDVHDRQSEIRSVNARLDNLADHFDDMMDRRPGAATPAPAGATVVVPPGPAPSAGPVIFQPQPSGQLPPGFQPTPTPVHLGGRPHGTPFPVDRTPTPPYTPVIPAGRSEEDIVIPPPPPGMPVPVIPDLPAGYPPQPQQQPHRRPYQQQEDEDMVIPPTPSGQSSSSGSSGEYRDQQPIHVIPPPMGEQVAVIPPPPTVVHVHTSHSRSRSRSSSSSGSRRTQYEPGVSHHEPPHVIHLPPSHSPADADAVPIPIPHSPQPQQQQPTVIVTGGQAGPGPAPEVGGPSPPITVLPPAQGYPPGVLPHGVQVPMQDVVSPQPTPMVIREDDPRRMEVHHTYSRSPSPSPSQEYGDRSRRPSHRSRRHGSSRGSPRSSPQIIRMERTHTSRSSSPSRHTPPPIVIPGQMPSGYQYPQGQQAPPIVIPPAMPMPMQQPMMAPQPTVLPTIPPSAPQGTVTIMRSRSRSSSRSSRRHSHGRRSPRTPVIVQAAPPVLTQAPSRPRSRSPIRIVEGGRTGSHRTPPPIVPASTVVIPRTEGDYRDRERDRDKRGDGDRYRDDRDRYRGDREGDRGYRDRPSQYRGDRYGDSGYRRRRNGRSRSRSDSRDRYGRRSHRSRRAPSYSSASDRSRSRTGGRRRYPSHSMRRSPSLEYAPSRAHTGRTHRSGSAVRPTVVVHASSARTLSPQSPVRIGIQRSGTARSRTSRRPQSPVSVHEYEPGRSPRVVRGDDYRSRSPTLIGDRHTAPTRITHHTTPRSPSPTETARPHPHRPPAATEYSDHDDRSPTRSPPIVRTIPPHTPRTPRQQVPTIMEIEGSHAPSEGIPPSRRGRRPSEVSHHVFEPEEEQDYGRGPTISGEPSRASSLERSYSQSDAPSIIPQPRIRVPASPRSSVRQQLQQAGPDVPVIPYLPTHMEEDDVPTPVPAPMPRIEATVPSVVHEVPVSEGPPEVHHIPPPSGVYAIPPSEDVRTDMPVAVPFQPHAPTSFDDLALADAERERVERFEDMEKQLIETVQVTEEGEQRREETFRSNEDERERLFLEHEARREAEAKAREEELLRNLEDRLAAIPVPPPPGALDEEHPPTEPPLHLAEIPHSEHEPSASPSRASSMRAPSIVDVDAERRTLVEATSRYSQELRDIIEAERDEARRQIDAERAERERRDEELAAERQRMDEEHQTHVRLLQEQIAALQAEKDERQAREMEDAQRHENERGEDNERAEQQAAQLADITNLVSEQRDECVRKRELQDQRWEEKQERRQMKDMMLNNMQEMISRLIQEKEECKIREDERMEQLTSAMQAMQHQTLQTMTSLKEEISDSLRQMAEDCRDQLDQQTNTILHAAEESAQKRVPFNVQQYLDEFSKSLAAEVRLLIMEVGKLHERRRTLQFQIGALLQDKAKYGPGGIYEDTWKPEGYEPSIHQEPIPEPPPPPMEGARPAWRQVRNRVRRVRNGGSGARPPHIAPQAPVAAAPVHIPPTNIPYPGVQPARASWNPTVWHPPQNPNISPVDPMIPQEMLHPPVPSPGLFGPRSPSSSIHRG